jgi:DNA modification methylase
LLEMNKIHCINCINGLKDLESESVNCCVTSPPYWGLRDYGVPGQLGLESTPEEYVSRMVEVFREVKRVLREDGTLWLNLGDSYAGSGKGIGSDHGKAVFSDDNISKTNWKMTGLKSKDLVGIPWMVAFALRADGWYLRQDIIWSKTNPMPESVTDRCTKSHEHIFLLSKSPKYYYDAEAIAEPVTESTVKRLSQDIESQSGSDRVPGKTNGSMKAAAPRYGGKKAAAPRYGGKKYTENPEVFNRTKSGNAYAFREKRNKRSVWTVSTQPFKDAHFATFPPKLIEPCILAGCPKDGIVLDPFMGSGTTGMVALQNQRNFIGFELNPAYIEIAEKHRLANVQQRII